MSKKDIIKGVDSFLSTYFEDNKFKYLFKNVTGCYFIDYENVTQNGLIGVDKLPKGSVICLFYSKRADKLPIDIVSAINVSKVKLLTFKVDVGQRNALDFQLVSLLGYIIAKHRQLKIFPYYHIITKDTGFNSIINMWANLGIDISRYETIAQSIGNISGVALEQRSTSSQPTTQPPPQPTPSPPSQPTPQPTPSLTPQPTPQPTLQPTSPPVTSTQQPTSSTSQLQASGIQSGLATVAVAPSISHVPIISLPEDIIAQLKVPNKQAQQSKSQSTGNDYTNLQKMLTTTFDGKTAKCIFNIAKGSNKQYAEFHTQLVKALGVDFAKQWYKTIKMFLPYK